jgi:hypothetical protein
MNKKQNIIIEKIPLEMEEKMIDRKPNFQKIKTLYLELLENKEKIKPNLVNKDHNPTETFSLEEKPSLNFVDDDANKSNTDEDFEKKFENLFDREIKRKEKKRKSRNNEPPSEPPSEPSEKKEDEQVVEKTQSENPPEEDKNNDNLDDEEELFKKLKNKESSDENVESTEPKEKPEDHSEKDDKHSDNKSIVSDGGLSTRLRQLLEDDDNDSVRSFKRPIRSKTNSYSSMRDERSREKYSETPVDKYSRKRDDRSGRDNRGGGDINRSVYSTPSYQKNRDPPTLSEIESKGGIIRKKEIRNIDYVSNEEYEEEDLKRELMFKFELLKKSYPVTSIPEFSIHTDYKTMRRTYENLVRKLSLDSTVENYKTYLIGGFMCSEFLLGNYLGFDMQGFTSQQILQMHQYEKLLIELGEKSYVPEGEGWSVEVRLLFLVITQTAFFVISKMIMKKTGANLMNMINSMSSVNTARSQAPKKKMKGPDINIDELP